MPEHFLRKIGPGINAGRTILLFGPPGNGKTTLATRISKLFRHVIYIPHAVEIEGQIMTVFDPSVHKRVETEEIPTQGNRRAARGVRPSLDAVPTSHGRRRRRAAARHARSQHQRGYAILRGAAPRQGAQRHLPDPPRPC
ncbi:MAG: hypothetical protein WDN69_19150 [Aliidongia sp.]